MRIAYLSNSIIPSSQANSIHVMQMCNALAQEGHDVVLFCRYKKGQRWDEICRFYDVKNTFNVVNSIWPRVPCGGMIYAIQVFWHLRRRMAGIDLMYSRCLYSALLASYLEIPLVYESHALPRTRLHRRLQSLIFSSEHLVGLVVISHALQKDYESAFPLLSGHVPVVVAPDAVKPAMSFVGDLSSAVPVRNGSPMRVVYTGSLLPGKGVDIVIALARKCSQHHFHILGGSPATWAKYEKAGLPENLLYHGFQPPGEVRRWQAGADILLLPNQREVLSDRGRVDIGKWTSPLKMFEYMASGVPLVASDLPILREILVPEDNCLMATPDDIESWSHAVQRLCADPELGRRLAANAKAEVAERYNWPARAKMILSHLPLEIPLDV